MKWVNTNEGDRKTEQIRSPAVLHESRRNKASLGREEVLKLNKDSQGHQLSEAAMKVVLVELCKGPSRGLQEVQRLRVRRPVSTPMPWTAADSSSRRSMSSAEACNKGWYYTTKGKGAKGDTQSSKSQEKDGWPMQVGGGWAAKSFRVRATTARGHRQRECLLVIVWHFCWHRAAQCPAKRKGFSKGQDSAAPWAS